MTNDVLEASVTEEREKTTKKTVPKLVNYNNTNIGKNLKKEQYRCLVY